MNKVVVDMGRCTGHGRCYSVAPDIFADDDEGRPIILISSVEGALEAQAQEAIAACPESAIWLESSG